MSIEWSAGQWHDFSRKLRAPFVVNETPVIVTAGSDATLLAFLINRRATLTHAGTIGG